VKHCEYNAYVRRSAVELLTYVVGYEHCISDSSPGGSSSSVCSGLVCWWVASSFPSRPRKGSDDWAISCCELDVVEVLLGAVEAVTSSRSAHSVIIVCCEYGAGDFPIIDVSISHSCWGNTI